MYKLLLPLSILFLCCQVSYVQQGTDTVFLYDNVIQDSFEIRVDNYRKQSNSGSYDTIVFYFDASLKAGNFLREVYSDSSHTNTLLVGIAHFGNYSQKRRRDLMEANNHLKHLIGSGI
jgi:hypothetical protein